MESFPDLDLNPLLKPIAAQVATPIAEQDSRPVSIQGYLSFALDNTLRLERTAACMLGTSPLGGLMGGAVLPRSEGEVAGDGGPTLPRVVPKALCLANGRRVSRDGPVCSLPLAATRRVSDRPIAYTTKGS